MLRRNRSPYPGSDMSRRFSSAVMMSVAVHVVVLVGVFVIVRVVSGSVKPEPPAMQFVSAQLGGGSDKTKGAPAPASEPVEKAAPVEKPQPKPKAPDPPKPPEKKPEEKKVVKPPEKKPEKKPDVPKPVAKAKDKKDKESDKKKEADTKPKEDPKKKKEKKDPNEPDPLMDPEAVAALSAPKAGKPKGPARDIFKANGNGADFGFDPNGGTLEGEAIQGPRGTTIGVPGILNAWAGLVQRKVEPIWVRPNALELEPGKDQTVLSFIVDRQGNLMEEPEIVQSGGRALDQSAMKALLDANPLPPLPDDFPGQSQKVLYGFTLTPE